MQTARHGNLKRPLRGGTQISLAGLFVAMAGASAIFSVLATDGGDVFLPSLLVALLTAPWAFVVIVVVHYQGDGLYGALLGGLVGTFFAAIIPPLQAGAAWFLMTELGACIGATAQCAHRRGPAIAWLAMAFVGGWLLVFASVIFLAWVLRG